MNNNYCFCTLALGERYRAMAKELAKDIERHAPGVKFVVLTDKPRDFSGNSNVLAFKHSQKNAWHCGNDKRFAVLKALAFFKTAIFIDADSRIVAEVPRDISWRSGISGAHESLIKHLTKYNPERLGIVNRLAAKLNISIDEIEWIGESLYIVTADSEGGELVFLDEFGRIGNYLELKGIHQQEGIQMGLAAAKAGWQVRSEEWAKLKAVITHQDASDIPYKQSFLQKQLRRFRYHYRLNKARIAALRDFGFYYR